VQGDAGEHYFADSTPRAWSADLPQYTAARGTRRAYALDPIDDYVSKYGVVRGMRVPELIGREPPETMSEDDAMQYDGFRSMREPPGPSGLHGFRAPHESAGFLFGHNNLQFEPRDMADSMNWYRNGYVIPPTPLKSWPNTLDSAGSDEAARMAHTDDPHFLSSVAAPPDNAQLPGLFLFGKPQALSTYSGAQDQLDTGKDMLPWTGVSRQPPWNGLLDDAPQADLNAAAASGSRGTSMMSVTFSDVDGHQSAHSAVVHCRDGLCKSVSRDLVPENALCNASRPVAAVPRLKWNAGLSPGGLASSLSESIHKMSQWLSGGASDACLGRRSVCHKHFSHKPQKVFSRNYLITNDNGVPKIAVGQLECHDGHCVTATRQMLPGPVGLSAMSELPPQSPIHSFLQPAAMAKQPLPVNPVMDGSYKGLDETLDTGLKPEAELYQEQAADGREDLPPITAAPMDGTGLRPPVVEM